MKALFTAHRLKALLALALMVAAFAGAAAWRPALRLADTLPKVDLASLFPARFGDWAVDERVPVQLISPDQAAVLNAIYTQTLSRTYLNGRGQRIMLSVAYGGDQSDATRAHRPEVCYPAQGFQVLSTRNGVFSSEGLHQPVRQLVTQLGGRVEPLSYWIVVGDRVTLTGTEQKLAQLAYGYRGMVADGLLVRVSSIDNNAEQAFALQQAFVQALAQAVPPAQRTRIFGQVRSH